MASGGALMEKGLKCEEGRRLGESRAELAERAVRAFGTDVYRLAFHQLLRRDWAEDVAQEVFLSLLSADAEFRDDGHLKAWLLRATISRCKNARRYRARHPEDCVDPQEASVFDRLDAGGMPDTETDARVWECLVQLPEDFRVAVCLHYVEGYKVDEVASMTGVPATTVRTRLFRARGALRKLLGGEGS